VTVYQVYIEFFEPDGSGTSGHLGIDGRLHEASRAILLTREEVFDKLKEFDQKFQMRNTKSNPRQIYVTVSRVGA
jgi:hypothetical protein